MTAQEHMDAAREHLLAAVKADPNANDLGAVTRLVMLAASLLETARRVGAVTR